MLEAHGTPPAGGQAGRVHGVFADTGSRNTGADAIVRVEAQNFTYSATERKGTLTGNVVAQQASGLLRAQAAQIFMSAVGSAGASPSRLPNPRGTLERMVAEGGVEVDQQERKGTGDRLVYTASDGRFVLSGRGAQPARMTDTHRGTVTGASLIFTNRGDSVEVDGGTNRTVTESEVRK